ncbi:MAG: GNAT family N-acetyltransferase [Pseudomonadota bacterium]
MSGKSPNSTIELIAGAPTPEDYLRLRKAGGLSVFSLEAARKGAGGAVHSVLLKRGGETVGIGRIIGDGGCMFQITDIVVLPDLQGQGLGKRIMGALMNWLEANAPEGAFVSLIADLPADKLYEKFGFRDLGDASIGMETRVGRR